MARSQKEGPFFNARCVESMSETHQALFWIATDFMSGTARLQNSVFKLTSLGPVISVSSVYKKFLYSRTEDLNSELCAVVKMGIEKSQNEVFDFLSEFIRQSHSAPQGSKTEIAILALDQEVRLYPGQNLPSPLLHSNSLILRCASEAWGGYEHPIIKKTLNELVKSSEPLMNVEFFAQGKVLL